MTDVAIVQTELRDGAAGEWLGQQLAERLGGDSPDAVIIFASPANDYTALLHALRGSCESAAIVGCSSAGEFTGTVPGQGLTCAIGLRAPEMRFAAAVGGGIAHDRGSAARALAGGFDLGAAANYRYHTALVLVDALAGYTEDFIEALTVATGGTHRFFGGGAGDDARFQSTKVFCGTDVYDDAAVGLQILSDKPIGIGARHGWCPASPPLRVTESDESRVKSLNVAPAVEAFAEHAETTSQRFDPADPMPFFLHNIVGVQTEQGHKLRVPLGVAEEGSIVCAADVPAGATAHIMGIEKQAAAEAATSAAHDAIAQVEREGYRPKAALFFDCVATRLRLGEEFSGELDAVSRAIGGVPFAGFNSYGQIVRAEGQFSGFHNCTAVVCVIPD